MNINDLNPYRYLHKTKNGKWKVAKRVNGKSVYFGTKDTLEEAQEYRNELIENNWDLNLKISGKTGRKLPSNVYRTHSGKYAVHKWINGHHHYYGLFDTIDEAENYTEYCEQEKWKEECKRTAKPRKSEYIYQANDKYMIRKSINGKLKVFGLYKTFEEAVYHRDLLKLKNWNKNASEDLNNPKNIEISKISNIYYYNEKYNIRKVINGKQTSFGAYKDLKEALQYKAHCEAHDWDSRLAKTRDNPSKYIIYDKSFNKYIIRRKINGKVIYFGSYATIEEAMAKKQELEENNWSKEVVDLKTRKYDLPKYITKQNNLYCVQKLDKDGKLFRIHFHDLKDAIAERDLLIRADWDIEELISLDEAYGTL